MKEVDLLNDINSYYRQQDKIKLANEATKKDLYIQQIYRWSEIVEIIIKRMFLIKDK